MARRSHWTIRRLAPAIAMVASFALPAAARAQKDTIVPAPFRVPDAPAFLFLGVSPSSVDQPTTPQKLAASIANAADSSGKVKSGLALGIAPAQFLNKWIGTTLTEYQNPAPFNPAYILWNSSLSVGTARAQEDTASTDLGMGWRSVIWDESDLLRDTAATNAIYHAVQTKCGQPPVAGGRPPGPAAIAACADSAYQLAAKAWADSGGGVWNHGGLATAGALGWRMINSQTSRMLPIGWSWWLAGSHNLGTNWLLTSLEARYDNRRPLAANSTITEREWSLGGRALMGTARIDAFLDLAARYIVSSDSVNKAWRRQWSGGIE